MILQEPYNSWLIKNIGENLDAGTRFVIKVNAVTSEGVLPVSIDLDLTWFVLLHSKDDDKINLDVALELLKEPAYLEQFQATLKIQNAKRLLAEYLLFKPLILIGLRKYIDFTLLNVPIDFISHTLFIKMSSEIDTLAVQKERLNIINLILDTGFELKGEIPASSYGVAAHKILMMDVGNEKYRLVRRLLGVGFHLFSDNVSNNREVAVTLIDSRAEQDCVEILKNCIPQCKELEFKVAGNQGNLADYYYWVKEDMKAVEFIRSVLNIDITS